MKDALYDFVDLTYEGTTAIYNTYGHTQLDDAAHSIDKARVIMISDGNFQMFSCFDAMTFFDYQDQVVSTNIFQPTKKIF